MNTLAENIERNILAWDETKQALIDKGQEIPPNTPVEDYADKIRAIGGDTPAPEWQPHPDWWDIETMVNTSVVPWRETPLTDARYGFVVSDSNNTIKLPGGTGTNVNAGLKFYLSDGTIYDSPTAAVTHTWDRTKDKDCSDGYKTRAVIVCKSADRNVAISQRAFQYDGIDSLYVYFGDCNITSLVFAGASAVVYANKSIQATRINNNTTANATSIGNNAFYNCYSLSSISIPSSVTSIGDSAFRYCQALKSIPIPSSVTSIENSAFAYCYSLSSISIPSSVTSISDYAFNNCYSLSSISIPSSVTSIATGILNSCHSLLSIILPNNFNLSLILDGTNSIRLSVSSMEQMIYNYADRSGQTALTLTVGAANLAKLSAEIKAVATAKNITLA